MRRRRSPVLPALVLLAAASPAAASQTVSVYFTRGDQLQRVERTIPDGKGPRVAAVRHLLAGPTKAERADGIGTDVPDGTLLTGVTVQDGVAVVRLSPEFRSQAGRGAKAARVAQLVGTLTRLGGVRSVRVVLGDAAAPSPLTGITLRDLPARDEVPPIPVTVGQVQMRLAELRYLPAKGAISGRLDYRTAQALTAFQAWEGLTRDGLAGVDTRKRLTIARTPAARRLTAARHIEVYRDRGVALLVEGKAVRRAVHVSTGAGGRTPAGNWNIYRKERNSWSRPFSVWLPYASYFRGGYAFHQYPFVPAYPASHGCIRVPAPEAPTVYEFAARNTPVTVV